MTLSPFDPPIHLIINPSINPRNQSPIHPLTQSIIHPTSHSSIQPIIHSTNQSIVQVVYYQTCQWMICESRFLLQMTSSTTDLSTDKWPPMFIPIFPVFFLFRLSSCNQSFNQSFNHSFNQSLFYEQTWRHWHQNVSPALSGIFKSTIMAYWCNDNTAYQHNIVAYRYNIIAYRYNIIAYQHNIITRHVPSRCTEVSQCEVIWCNWNR